MRDPFVETLLEKNELGTLRRLATSRRSRAVQPGMPTSIIRKHIPCQIPPGVPGKKEKPVFASEIAILSGTTITNPPQVVGQFVYPRQVMWSDSYTRARVQVVRFAPARCPTRRAPNWSLRRRFTGLPAPTDDGGWRSRQPVGASLERSPRLSLACTRLNLGTDWSLSSAPHGRHQHQRPCRSSSALLPTHIGTYAEPVLFFTISFSSFFYTYMRYPSRPHPPSR